MSNNTALRAGEDTTRTITLKNEEHKKFFGNCLGAHYSNINSGFPINAFFIASTAFFPCFLGKR